MSEMTPKTVLLVEDDEDSREIYGTMLRHQGYRVLVAETGPEALEAAGEHLPDAVVLDLGLPEMDGVEVARRLREDPRTAGIAILVLTVHSQPGDRADAREAGCDRYLVKPADPAGVGEEIGRMLGITV
jgi:CheY-like chemotaxis protein